MDSKLRKSIMLEICKYHNCSDINDNQYPDCDIWGSNGCEATTIVDRIEPLLNNMEAQNKSDNTLKAEIAGILDDYKLAQYSRVHEYKMLWERINATVSH